MHCSTIYHGENLEANSTLQPDADGLLQREASTGRDRMPWLRERSDRCLRQFKPVWEKQEEKLPGLGWICGKNVAAENGYNRKGNDDQNSCIA